MRNYVKLRYLPLATLMTLAPLNVSAQDPQATIDVQGTAEINVVPDEVFIVFGVETSNPSMSVAKSENDLLVKKLLTLTAD